MWNTRLRRASRTRRRGFAAREMPSTTIRMMLVSQFPHTTVTEQALVLEPAGRYALITPLTDDFRKNDTWEKKRKEQAGSY